MATRTGFRPRPLDTTRQLNIVRDIKELDDGEQKVSRDIVHSHEALDKDNEEVSIALSEMQLGASPATRMLCCLIPHFGHRALAYSRLVAPCLSASLPRMLLSWVCGMPQLQHFSQRTCASGPQAPCIVQLTAAQAVMLAQECIVYPRVLNFRCLGSHGV